MSQHLTQRDRVLISETVRRYLARDIEQREIADTYDPAVLGVSAFELAHFADELLHCCDCDAEDLAEGVARDIAEAVDGAQDVAEMLAPLKVLRRLEAADPSDIEHTRKGWDL